MNKSTTGLILACLILPGTGCDYLSEFNAALPDIEDLRLEVPEVITESSDKPDEDAPEAQGEEGQEDMARCAAHSNHLAKRVNQEVERVLDSLDRITSHPPTETDGAVSIWMPPEEGMGKPPQGQGGGERPEGPPPEGAEGDEARPEGQPPQGHPPMKVPHRLMVESAEDGSFGFTMQVSLEEGGEWLDHIVGRVDAGSTREAGSGMFEVNYDVLGGAEPEVSRGGSAGYAYLFTGEGARTIDVELKQVSHPDGDVMDGAVFFDRDASGFVTLESSREGLNAEGVEEAMVNFAQWEIAGAGRCDGAFTGADLGESTAYRSQCWDESITEVFFSETIDDTSTTRGDESACAFSAATLPSL